jgi:hypothetical protein
LGQKNNRPSYPRLLTSAALDTMPCGSFLIRIIEFATRTEFLASIVIFARLFLTNKFKSFYLAVAVFDPPLLATAGRRDDF